ncbi:MAG: YkgJ family cysteine cluster protein [Candidatus Heimdallarchaeota archaeon]|nr:YkgJ family cysteine cluster protein [Candidatus Heimdallarchaeota archaeon]
MNEAFQALKQIYDELAQEISTLDRKPKCFNCGACCNFNYFDHTPFVTTLELMHINAGMLENGSLKTNMQIQTDEILCPFFIEKTCMAHTLRPFSCRVYFCNLHFENHVANGIYEKYHRKIKHLHENSGTEYNYMPLVSNLRNLIK